MRSKLELTGKPRLAVKAQLCLTLACGIHAACLHKSSSPSVKAQGLYKFISTLTGSEGFQSFNYLPFAPSIRQQRRKRPALTSPRSHRF